MKSWEPEVGCQAQMGLEKGGQPCPSGRGFEIPLGFRMTEV